MPVVNNISRCDLALLSSTAGSLPVSGGPAATDYPVFDPNFVRLDGVNIVKTPNSNGRHKQVENVSADQPTSMPWSETYSGQVIDGVPDHIYTRGWHPNTVAAGFPSLSENWENYFAPGDPNGANTLEMHRNYLSADGTVSYRFWNGAVYMDTHSYDEHYRCRQITWYGRLGTLPLLMIQTANGDGGTVTITNDGTANPLRIDSTGSGLILFNTGSTGGLVINHTQQADANNTTRSSPAIAIQGYAWNGSTSVGRSTTLQHVVASPTSDYLRLKVASANHYFDSSGKVGINLPGLNYLSQNMVIPFGAYGMVRQNQSGTQALIGLDGNNVKLSPDGWQINLGANFFCQSGGLLGATSGQRGILDARGTVWIGSAGSTHGLIDSADGVYINANANGTGTNPIIFASGRSTTSGGTVILTLNSTGSAQFAGSVGFNGTAPVAKPTVTGSRTDGTALANLLTALAATGLLTNSSAP